MYELMFGITAAPFRLTPDTAFYFDGQAHRAALESLRSGVFQRSGFTLLTGDIGAGKTTLLRTLIEELESGGAVVGEIVSAQLDAEEMILAVAYAFGVAADEGAAEATAGSLFAFFAGLGAHEKGAILAVDEAHNLSHEALLQLVRLSAAAATQRVPLHVVLVGQTELRPLLDSPALAPLKKQVRSAFHLDPLAAGEVRSYVEHRLRTVNWTGNPSFDAAAFDEIFRWTGGVPRRVNLLCNRLLLSCFLATSSHVTVAAVAESGEALRDEIDAPESAATAMVDLMASTTTHREDEPEEMPAPPAPAEASRAEAEADDPVVVSPAGEPRPILCIVAEEGDFVDAAALMGAMAGRKGMCPAVLLRVFRKHKEQWTLTAFGERGGAMPVADIDLGTSAVRVHGGELRQRFIEACTAARPSAVVVFRATDVSLVCSIAARQHRIPVVSVGPAARERRQQAARDEVAKRLWLALHPAPDLRP